MSDTQEKLDAMVERIGRMPCPSRYDECKPSGCMGGGQSCSLHLLLDPGMVAAIEMNRKRQELRELADLRTENAQLKERIEQIAVLVVGK